MGILCHLRRIIFLETCSDGRREVPAMRLRPGQPPPISHGYQRK